MKIKNPQSALLSNHEVYAHIQSESAHYLSAPSTSNKALSNTREILQDGLRYFTPSPTTTEFTNPATHLSTLHPTRPLTLYKGPHSLFRALAPKFRLNKAEYLMMYNVRPSSRIALELVVEEAPSRFSDAELDEMLDIVIRVLEEEEEAIPVGVEDLEMEKVPEEMLGDSRRNAKARRKAGRRKV